jgi:sulfate transport system ATP-binding protein
VNIEARSITKRFGGFTALANVDLDVQRGELVALLGPSGSGKTTLLRVIAGLEAPDAGRVLFGGLDATTRSARDRNVGFVFQHYALFRHMTVFENIAFGLRVRPRRSRPSAADIRARVGALLDLVQLAPFADRYPSQLSGGQRQRVALARALAVEPAVLLLDEPFGALDAKVRKELRRWLRRLHDDLQVTSLFVTHDQEEALELADRVVIMNRGRVEQVGSPEAVYARPQSPFVYDFLGDVNVFHVRIGDGAVHMGDLSFEMSGLGDGARRARVYVRPHLLEISRDRDGHPAFPAHLVHVSAAGPLAKLELTSAWGEPVRVEMPQARFRALGLQQGDPVSVSFIASDLFISPDDGAEVPRA